MKATPAAFPPGSRRIDKPPCCEPLRRAAAARWGRGNQLRIEVPTLIKRSEEGLTLLPVLVRPCPWKTVDWLRDRRILPEKSRALSGGDDSEVETDLANIAQEVHRILHRPAEENRTGFIA